MNQYFSLCKVEMSTLVSTLMHKKKSGGLILMMPFVFMAILSVGYTLLMKAQVSGEMAMNFMLFIALLMITVFSFTTISGVLLNYSGVERLLSLPIAKWMILAAKLTVLYVYMLFSAICLMLPCILLSGVGGAVAASSVVMTLFLPAIPIVVAGVVMAVGKALVARLHMGIFLKYALGIIGFMALIVGLMFIQFSMMGKASNPADMEMLLSSIPFYSMYFSGALQAALATLIQAVLLALFVFVVSRFLWKNPGSGERSAAKAAAAKGSSPFAALLKKEAALYFSVPLYVFNTIPGPALLLLAGIVVIVKPDLLGYLRNYGLEPYALGVLVVCFVLGIASTSNSSVSIEGTRLYQLKSMPIPAFKLFFAKICFNLILLVPSSTVICILAGIRAFSPAETLVLVLAVLAISGLVSAGGLLVNLKFPMLDYTSAMAVVKQSTSVMITTFSGMGVTLLMFGAMFLFRFALLPVSLVFAAILAADVWIVLYIKKHSETMLSKL